MSFFRFLIILSFIFLANKSFADESAQKQEVLEQTAEIAKQIEADDEVPLNDPGGVITDTWDLKDRIVVLAVQSFELKDCCTNRLIEYTTCLALVQPK